MRVCRNRKKLAIDYERKGENVRIEKNTAKQLTRNKF